MYWLNKQWLDTRTLFANTSLNQVSLWYFSSEIIKRSTFKYRWDFCVIFHDLCDCFVLWLCCMICVYLSQILAILKLCFQLGWLSYSYQMVKMLSVGVSGF